MHEVIGLVVAVVIIGGAIWFIRKRKAEAKAEAPTTGGSTGGKSGGGKNVKLK
jgi:hypothetical protein